MKPSTVTAEIDVDAPIRAVYNQWTQFESFPEFLHAVKEVTQHDDARTHWVVSIGGVRREFEAEITEQVPDEIIAWASIDGKSHTGSVSFGLTEGTGTHVRLEMMWLPETFVERVGAALDLDERQAEMDLRRFKEFIEERGRETGAWRGEIHDGVPEEAGGTLAESYADEPGPPMATSALGDDLSDPVYSDDDLGTPGYDRPATTYSEGDDRVPPERL
jgi:uncharacterized protein YndB with AHSA1/START domain